MDLDQNFSAAIQVMFITGYLDIFICVIISLIHTDFAGRNWADFMEYSISMMSCAYLLILPAYMLFVLRKNKDKLSQPEI
jgi:hypothetical protein